MTLFWEVESVEKRKKERSSCKSNQRGVLTFWFIFTFLIITLVVLFAFTLPVSLNVQTKMYEAGEDQLNDALITANSIEDSNAKSLILGVVNDAKGAQEENIEIVGFLIQYGWVFILIIVSAISYLWARSFVETQQGAF